MKGDTELRVVTATGAVLNAERRLAAKSICADARMLEYEHKIREEDRMRKRQMYYASLPDGSPVRRP
jgi:hypothetical protein